MTADFETTPLSEMRHPYGMQRHYPEGPDRDRQITGDQALLIRLEEACREHTPFAGKPPTVAELPEHALQAIVCAVEKMHRGSWHWQLAGDPADPIIQRLDAHFAALQEGWREERIRREERIADRAAATIPHGPFLDPVENGKRDAALWGLPVA